MNRISNNATYAHGINFCGGKRNVVRKVGDKILETMSTPLYVLMKPSVKSEVVQKKLLVLPFGSFRISRGSKMDNFLSAISKSFKTQ